MGLTRAPECEKHIPCLSVGSVIRKRLGYVTGGNVSKKEKAKWDKESLAFYAPQGVDKKGGMS
jgi:hypothetical protein